jgi:hypothetical protein
MKNYLKQYLINKTRMSEKCMEAGTDKTDKTSADLGSVSFVSDYPDEYPENYSDRSHVSEDSQKPDSAITLTYSVGNCPHCRQPLKVFNLGGTGEIWIQCPTKPDLFKALYQDERERCRDCEIKKSVICGRCSECIQRLLLCPKEVCPSCGSLRFWRHRASKDQPAGSLWRCMSCDEPTGNVAVYTIEGGRR